MYRSLYRTMTLWTALGMLLFAFPAMKPSASVQQGLTVTQSGSKLDPACGAQPLAFGPIADPNGWTPVADSGPHFDRIG